MLNCPHTTGRKSVNTSLTAPHGHVSGFLPNEEVVFGGEWLEEWGAEATPAVAESGSYLGWGRKGDFSQLSLRIVALVRASVFASEPGITWRQAS